ncbi:hypothetical protein [Jeotgalibaca caeni]|uniref:hypothetical protein n=1 Tax=Jeotgalibaca caeni TaxID=3028623 RepID=UPI00237E2C76|nr:hypothetical protein [Jeotgalibaca caeni]MDE1548206.1 hypothetical protein [Jeotgalibaca caeni]
MDVPVNLAEQRGMPMDLGMEYEILLLQIGSLTRKRFAAEQTVKEHEAQLDEVLSRVEKKSDYLERLQKESFSNTVMKLFGTYEDVLNRESEETLRAKLEFDKAYALKVAAQRKLIDLDEEMEEKKNRMRSVKEHLLRRNPELENVVSERDQVLVQLQYEYVQTVEAEEAAYQLLESIGDILVTLDSSEAISGWDKIMEIDVLLNFMKRDQLDAAEARLLDLERKVQAFERELHDLHYIYENQYAEVTAARPAIEAFITDLFSDWSTKKTIEKNLQQLKALEQNVLTVMELLITQKRDLEKEYLKMVQTDPS